MILDIIIIVLILLSAAYGFRKGLVFTLVHSVGWFAALALAYLLTPPAEEFVRNHTGWYDTIYGIVADKFTTSLEAVEVSLNSLPTPIQPDLMAGDGDLVEAVSTGFAEVFSTILVFVGLFFLLKILFWLVLHFLSKDYRDGFANTADGLFGALFGLVRGIILVMVLMALMIPLVNLASTDLTLWLTDQLEQSTLAQSIYYNNVLLILNANSMGI